jgi:hypothetical protein
MHRTEDTGEQKDYISYLLRMWRDSAGQGPAPSKETLWRASLQSPHTGDLVGFASLEAMFGFLRQLASVQPKSLNEDEDRQGLKERRQSPGDKSQVTQQRGYHQSLDIWEHEKESER